MNIFQKAINYLFNRQQLPKKQQSVPYNPYGTLTSFNPSLSSDSFLPRRFRNISQFGLGSAQVKAYTPEQLLDILSETNPDISLALWNFKRIAHSGLRFRVYNYNTNNEDKTGLKIVDRFIKSLNKPNVDGYTQGNGFDNFISQMFLSAFVKGAISAELLLNTNREPLSIIAVDPSTISFKSEIVNGIYQWYPYQTQTGVEHKPGEVWDNCCKRLNYPTFFYIPLDPALNDQYGTSPILPALNIIFFQMQMMIDLETIIHNQGFPRIDISVLEELMIKNSPAQYKSDPIQLQNFLKEQISNIRTYIENMNPDDAFIHFDSVKVDMVEPRIASIDIKSIIAIIDTQVIAAVKSLGTLMGRHLGSTETYADAEISIYVLGIKSVQKLISSLVEQILTLVLRLNGKNDYVVVEFLPIELRSETELAQWRQMEINNWLTLRDEGFVTDDEACIKLTGHGLPDDNQSVQRRTEGNPMRRIVGAQLPIKKKGNGNGGNQQYISEEDKIKIMLQKLNKDV